MFFSKPLLSGTHASGVLKRASGARTHTYKNAGDF